MIVSMVCLFLSMLLLQGFEFEGDEDSHVSDGGHFHTKFTRVGVEASFEEHGLKPVGYETVSIFF